LSGALSILVGHGGAPGSLNGALPNGGQAVGANFAIKNDGTYLIDAGLSGSWVTPNGNAALFDIMVTVTGGAFTSGAATGAWLNLGTTRTWTRTGSGVVTFTVQFRVAATGQIVSTQAGITVTVP
jgi:hypothetical protein